MFKTGQAQAGEAEIIFNQKQEKKNAYEIAAITSN